MDDQMLARLNPMNHRASVVSADSRRESVDGRMAGTFSDMKIQANSPYTSANPSTTSIQSTLQQQRNPALSNGGQDRLSASRFPGGAYQTKGQRYGRTAPTITGPATSSVANAAEPTKGQPWAFPDEKLERRDSQLAPSIAESFQSSYMESRRSSIADSLASSQYTTESRLPPGQRQLDEGYAPQHEFRRGSSELAGGQTHHHHSLRGNRVDELRAEEGSSPNGTQPYSRTPELRKSHKLAERKRRSEMKELYDELKDILPTERGNKTSKWEILSKCRFPSVFL
jgi:hypothetical protein